MSATSRQSRLVRAVVSPTRGAGELVTLPTGQVYGVFELPGGAVDVASPGARVPLTQQAHPALTVRTADAAALKEQDPVIARGITYLVVRLDPDGEGMTRVELMLPGAETGTHPEQRAWR